MLPFELQCTIKNKSLLVFAINRCSHKENIAVQNSILSSSYTAGIISIHSDMIRLNARERLPQNMPEPVEIKL